VGYTCAGRIQHDLIGMESGILPGIAVRLELDFSSDAFRLMCKTDVKNDDYKFEISDLVLHVPVGDLNPKIYSNIESRLDLKKEAKLWYTRTSVMTKVIPKGTKVFDSSIFPSTAQLPARLILCFLSLLQFSGTLKTNPYEFKRKWLNTEVEPKIWVWIESIELSLNGRTLDSLKTNATEQDDLASFLRLNLLQGVQDTPLENGITYQKFLDNSAFYPFDLTTNPRSRSEDIFVPSIRHGIVRLSITFSSELPVDLNLLIHQEHPSLMKMDKNRALTMSYFSTSI